MPIVTACSRLTLFHRCLCWLRAGRALEKKLTSTTAIVAILHRRCHVVGVARSRSLIVAVASSQ